MFDIAEIRPRNSRALGEIALAQLLGRSVLFDPCRETVRAACALRCGHRFCLSGEPSPVRPSVNWACRHRSPFPRLAPLSPNDLFILLRGLTGSTVYGRVSSSHGRGGVPDSVD